MISVFCVLYSKSFLYISSEYLCNFVLLFLLGIVASFLNNDCIDSYGSNYFSSYCSLYNIDDSDEAFIEAFKIFKKDILKYCYNQNELLDFQTFKDMEAEDTSKSKTLFDRVF